MDNLGISSRARSGRRGLKWSETPKLPYNKYLVSGVYFQSWDAPGAPGVSSTEEWQKSAIFILPGVLTDAWEMAILQDEAPKLPEILEISSGSRREAAAGMTRQQVMQELERKRMDWLLGLLIPVKWALVLIAVYFLVVLLL